MVTMDKPQNSETIIDTSKLSPKTKVSDIYGPLGSVFLNCSPNNGWVIGMTVSVDYSVDRVLLYIINAHKYVLLKRCKKSIKICPSVVYYCSIKESNINIYSIISSILAFTTRISMKYKDMWKVMDMFNSRKLYVKYRLSLRTVFFTEHIEWVEKNYNGLSSDSTRKLKLIGRIINLQEWPFSAVAWWAKYHLDAKDYLLNSLSYSRDETIRDIQKQASCNRADIFHRRYEDRDGCHI